MNIITLLTDFGAGNWYQASMKGVIKRIAPNTNIIDITHSVNPFDIDQAIFVCASTYHYFPANTIHVIVVDPGVGSSRKPVIVITEHYCFVAPDNGVLEWIFETEKIQSIHEIVNQDYFHHPVSNTFHGRDIFAPSAAHLSLGKPVDNFGKVITEPVRKKDFYPIKINEKTIQGKIIINDVFGNCITNIHKSDFTLDNSSRFTLKTPLNEFHDITIGSYYAQGENGETFLLFGSSGFLEIVQRESNVKDMSGLKNGNTIEITSL